MWALACSTVGGSSGHPGVNGAYPASSYMAAHRSQLLGSSQRPWMNTTGGRPVLLAASISSTVSTDNSTGLSGIVPPRRFDKAVLQSMSPKNASCEEDLTGGLLVEPPQRLCRYL